MADAVSETSPFAMIRLSPPTLIWASFTPTAVASEIGSLPVLAVAVRDTLESALAFTLPRTASTTA